MVAILIEFSNYIATEMLEIFKGMAQEQSLTLGAGVEERLLVIFRQWETEQQPTFGNGREVRKLFEAVCIRQDNRLITSGITDKVLLYQIEKVDIPVTVD